MLFASIETLGIIMERKKKSIGKTKEFSTMEFERIIRNNGFIFDRQRGDHKIYKRKGETVVLNKNLNKMVARRLIKEHNLKF